MQRPRLHPISQFSDCASFQEFFQYCAQMFIEATLGGLCTLSESQIMLKHNFSGAFNVVLGGGFASAASYFFAESAVHAKVSEFGCKRGDVVGRKQTSFTIRNRIADAW